MIKRTSELATLGVLAGSLLVLASSQAAETNTTTARSTDKFAEIFGDPVVAKGTGVEVKRSQVNEAIVNYKAALAAEGRNVSAQELRRLERSVVDQLIGQQLLLNRATAEDRSKGKEQMDSALLKFRTENKLSEEEFEEKILSPRLRAQGLTREQWSKQQLDQATVLSVLERELKINVTDEEVKKYYEEHPSQFEEPERVRVSHILISTKEPQDNSPDLLMRRQVSDAQKQIKRKQMDELLKRARAGDDFTKLAKEYSEDQGVKQNNGEIIIARGTAAAPPEFKAAAFSLEPNQISEVITSTLGYHLIKLVEKIPAQKMEFAKVSERLKQGMKQQEILKQSREYMVKIQKDANVEILDEKLKADAEAENPFKSLVPEEKK